MSEQRLICFDFDGVLYTYESGWQGLTNLVDPPVEGALPFIRQCFAQGCEVAIWSMRTARDRYLEGDNIHGYHFSPERDQGIKAIQKWLLYWGLEPELVSRIEFPFGKCNYTLIVEDRGFRFRGKDYPDISDVDALEPWMKSPAAKAYLRKTRIQRMQG